MPHKQWALLLKNKNVIKSYLRKAARKTESSAFSASGGLAEQGGTEGPARGELI